MQRRVARGLRLRPVGGCFAVAVVVVVVVASSSSFVRAVGKRLRACRSTLAAILRRVCCMCAFERPPGLVLEIGEWTRARGYRFQELLTRSLALCVYMRERERRAETAALNDFLGVDWTGVGPCTGGLWAADLHCFDTQRFLVGVEGLFVNGGWTDKINFIFSRNSNQGHCAE